MDNVMRVMSHETRVKSVEGAIASEQNFEVTSNEIRGQET